MFLKFKEITEIMYYCKFCNVAFNSQKKLNEHFKTQKHKKNFEQSNISVSDLEKFRIVLNNMQSDFQGQIDKLKENQKRIDNDNHILRNRLLNFEKKRKVDVLNSLNFLFEKPTIMINKFGNENISFVNDKIAHKLMLYSSMFIRNAVKLIYFNDAFPENQNINMTNLGQEILETFDGSKWNSIAKKIILEEIIDNLFCTFEREFGETFKSNYSNRTNYKKWLSKYETLTDSDNSDYKKQMNKETNLLDLFIKDEIKKRRDVKSAKTKDEQKFKNIIFEEYIEIYNQFLETDDDNDDISKKVIEILKSKYSV